MTTSPRLILAFALLIVTTRCRCEYERVDLDRADGSMDGSLADGSNDTGVADGAPDGPDGTTPTAVALTDETRTALRGGMIGTAFDDVCPDDQALVGARIHVQDDGLELISAIEGTCATLTVTQGGTVTTAAQGSLTLRGDIAFASPVTLACPQDQVIVGFSGRAGTALDAVTFTCAPLTASGATITVGAPTTLPQQGGTGGAAFALSCPWSQIARGRRGYSGTFVESLGLVCATPVAQP